MFRTVFAALSFLLPSLAFAEIAFKENSGKLEITVGGKPFTAYHFADDTGSHKPFFWPVMGPYGAPVTRAYPNIKDAPDEMRDHPHHRGLHFTHGEVSVGGKPFADFWAENGKNPLGKIVHTGFDPAPAVKDGVLEFGTKNNWNDPDGTTVLTEHTRWKIADLGGGAAMFSAVITLSAGAAGPVKFLDTKEGSFAIRVASSMDEDRGKADKRPADARGKIANSDGKAREKECWGKPADWVDYSGPVAGKTVGIAMFDHPDNKPRCRWHVRAYGLFAANPFGQKQFDPKLAAAELTLEPGKTLTLRYGVLIHAGDAAEGKVADRFKEYIALSK